MTQEEKIEYWIKSSELDFKSMINLFKSKEYVWSLFVGHLMIEKLLKGLYAKNIGDTPPFIHDLVKIAKRTSIELTDEIQNTLDLVTSFNIEGRYSNYKSDFREKCTRKYAREKIIEIKRLRLWLLNQLGK